jgi:membrane protein
MFLLALLYYFGPNVKQSFVFISPGSIIATLLWIAVVFGFQIYLTFSDPGSAYGTFGGIIVLLFFLYVTAIVFLLGAEINAVVGRQKDPETIADLNSGRERSGTPAKAGKGARSTPIVQPVGMYGPEVPHERSAKTKVIALGAVGVAAAVMLGTKVKGILGR